MAGEVGWLPLWRAMRSKNACKTCALGMGGQKGGMVNEAGHFPEFCKKSLQAMAADMRGAIDASFYAQYSLAQMRQMSSRELEALGRITHPLLAAPGDTHFRVISWEEALDLAAASLKGSTPERSFFYASGRSSNEAGFLLHLLARSYGSNHVNNCSYYCHQASGAGLSDSLGTGTATVELGDIDRADLIFVIGANPASNHPRLTTSLAELRKRGGEVIAINPVRELGLESFRIPSKVRSMLFGSSIASMYVQPCAGGDAALLAGLCKATFAQGAVDLDYIKEHTEGANELAEYLTSLTWEELERQSGVSREIMEEVARRYAKSKAAIFSWSMGITHHLHGTENVQWIVNLALLRGMIGKPGAGMMPIRGHSNVQGIGTVGVTPRMRDEAVKRLEDLGIPFPKFRGYDTLTALEASHRGEMKTALCLGGNIFGASPDSQFSEEALGRLETITYLSTTLNTGHVHGRGKTTLILPVKARDEESQPTTQESMFNYVRLSDGGPERYSGPRSEVDVLSSLARLVLPSGGPVKWEELSDHESIRQLIARLIPHLEPMAEIGASKQEFEIPGRVLHRPKFGTASGRARFRAHPIPQLPVLAEDEFRLMTGRSEGQFNTVVYEDYDLYRGQERRDVILLNSSDIERLGLQPDQPLEVRSDAGTMSGVVVRPFEIAAGCALMYYPEANVLIGRQTDPRSRTPAFKSTTVRIVPIK